MTGRKRTAQYVMSEKPCSRGHVGARYQSGNCVQCALDREAAKAQDPEWAERKRQRERARHQANPEPGRQRSNQYHHANRDRLNARAAERYSEDRERRKAAMQQYRTENPSKVKQSQQRYAAANKGVLSERNKAWRSKNHDYVLSKNRVHSKRHYTLNPAYYAFKKRLREARQRQAVPAWADLAKIKAIYEEARRLTIQTGIRMSVDHVIPLYATNASGQHIACGLHVENNLQIMTLEENKQKGTRI